MHTRLEPKILTIVREGYTLSAFGGDLLAGVIVGIVALPLSIALAIASGVKPEQGLYTAIVAGFVISLLSGSRVQIGGPTGAFIVLVYATVQRFGYDGLATATLMAGALLVCMGLARLGAAIKFIPYPVTVGFTSGIAVIIFAAQLRDFLGLDMPPPPGEFLGKLAAYAHHLGSVNPHAVALGVASYLLIVHWPRVSTRIPGPMVAIVAVTAAARLLHLPVETIGSRFGPMSGHLPTPQLPSLRWDLIVQLFPSALAIALLGGIESLLSAVVADGMTGRRHRSNMELVAQGVANLVSPLFQGIPATGAIARTATNVRNGGTTPFAGIIHAVTLLVILLVLGRWAGLIPMAVLAAILMRVAHNMGEWHLISRLLRTPKSDVLVLVSTFGLTVLVDLVVAIEVGVVMAAMLFMRRMSEVTETGFITRELRDLDENGVRVAEPPPVPPGVEIFRIAGPFFFGAVERFKDAMRSMERPPRVLILRLREVPVMDATAHRALEDVFERCRREGTTLLLSGLHEEPRRLMTRTGLLERIGPENVLRDITAAVARAAEIRVE